MDHEAVVTFRVYHNEETPLSMSAGLLLFFSLHGSSVLHMVQDSFILDENDIYIASPLTLYRVVCREGAALLSMMIAPEILRRTGWEEGRAADCVLSAERASDASHNAIRQGMAALWYYARQIPQERGRKVTKIHVAFFGGLVRLDAGAAAV